jgi:hypothetical protein
MATVDGDGAMRVIAELCSRLAARLPAPHVIMDREGGSPYLSRYYLFGDRSADFKGRPLNLFLHHFHKSDDDGALHSHPWRWAVALCLAGGYSEERRVGDRVVRRDILPGSVNLLRAETYHRVDLFGVDSWSLFLVGPRTASGAWFFWDRLLKARAFWSDYIEHKRTGVDARWQSDSREGYAP